MNRLRVLRVYLHGGVTGWTVTVAALNIDCRRYVFPGHAGIDLQIAMTGCQARIKRYNVGTPDEFTDLIIEEAQ